MTDTEPAYESDELDLSETDRISARHAMAVAGGVQPSLTKLLELLKRDGQDPALLECALGLPLEQYRKFEAAYKRTPRPRRVIRRGA